MGPESRSLLSYRHCCKSLSNTGVLFFSVAACVWHAGFIWNSALGAFAFKPTQLDHQKQVCLCLFLALSVVVVMEVPK